MAIRWSCDSADTCCRRQERPDSQFRRWYLLANLDVTFLLPTPPIPKQWIESRNDIVADVGIEGRSVYCIHFILKFVTPLRDSINYSSNWQWHTLLGLLKYNTFSQ